MNNNPLHHFWLPNKDLAVSKVAAQVADIADNAIVSAIIRTAAAEGVTDLYLMDKAFVLAALREKIARAKNEPLTIEELRQMNGEPVWIAWPDGRIKNHWWIVGSIEWHMMDFDDSCSIRDYGKVWIAYRNKHEVTP